MRKWIGSLCVILGVACLLGAIGFVLYNQWEAQQAAQISQTLLEDIQGVIEENKTNPDAGKSDPEGDNGVQDGNASGEMQTVKVKGYDCIGILSIPVLELELPVLTDWSYAKLKKAPCHYYGSYYGADFVIAAHNYKAHFGRLSELQAGDLVVFTDVSGTARYYEVVLLETLPKEATQEMIASGFDLSLYTCTPGGANRVTVRCKLKTNG